MATDERVRGGARAVTTIAPALAALRGLDDLRADLADAASRGYFRPAEEERLRDWFARYLTARSALREVLDDLAPVARARRRGEDDARRVPSFAVAYAAVCLLVRSARFVLSDVAVHRVVQRKLNEASPRHRIPRKQYTRLYRSLTSPRNAWRLSGAISFADEHRAAIEALGADPLFAPVLEVIETCEPALRVRTRDYLKARLRYRWHAWRRRRSAAAQRAFFRFLEGSGRMVADVRWPWHRDRVTRRARRRLAALLRPGDVIVTRHARALSNLFLPGFWPHAALYVGPPSVRETMGFEVAAACAERWRDPCCVLEARKDGVRLREIDDTLAVDAVAIIRPRLGDGDLARALENALRHEGKSYNFDFDFFTDDRLVCTEVVYRAYEGVGGLSFSLMQRSGRMTLSAEDVLDMARQDRGFETIAVFGMPGQRRRLLTGDAAHAWLRRDALK